MHIKSLYLKNFRNYEEQTIDFCPFTNIIYGENAQGKTNILEAIYLTSMGKSHRTQRYNEMIKWGKDFCRINTKYNKSNNDGDIDYLIKKNQKKQIKVNSIKLNKLNEILGVINIVMFSPEHMKIIKDGPSERRKFIDSILSQTKPRYFYNLSQYLKVVEQRNILLSKSNEKKEIEKTLHIWDSQLTDFGSKIIKDRNDFIKSIRNNVNKVNSELSKGKETLEILYKPSVNFKEDNLCEIKNAFEKRLQKSKEADIKRGVTSYGPHRDEIVFLINGKDLRSFGSQGQQRSGLLSLKIAEMKFIKEETNIMPVLLLDDVFSELDIKRQNYLLYYIKNMQVILTCTNYEGIEFSNINDCSYFKVKNGYINI